MDRTTASSSQTPVGCTPVGGEQTVRRVSELHKEVKKFGDHQEELESDAGVFSEV